MTTGNRPLSPHLGIYRFRWTMALSILNRITGAGLAGGMLLLAWWLIAAAAGPVDFALVSDLIASWFGRILLFGWTWALFFHLLNGIRHMIWDTGRGLDLPAAWTSGMLVVAGSVVLSLATFAGGYMVAGN